MAGPININPNIIPQAQAGMSEESIAASAEMVVTGLEKSLNIKKAGQVQKNQQVDLKQIDEYVQKLSETTTVNEINKWEQKEKQRQKKKEEDKPKRRALRKAGKSRARAFGWISRKAPPRRDVILNAGEIDTFGVTVNSESLKEYVLTYTRSRLGIDEGEEGRESLVSIEQKIKGLKGGESFLLKMKDGINRMLIAELSRAIKQSILNKVNAGKKFTEWLISSRKSEEILNYALYNEYTSGLNRKAVRGLTGKIMFDILSRNWDLTMKQLEDLIELAKESRLDLPSWYQTFSRERVTLTSDGKVKISSSIIESELQKNALLDEFKMLHIHLALEEGLIRTLAMWLRLRKVNGGLTALRVGRDEIALALTQAKRIAWAKIITKLKEAHLTRVFSTSEKEFEKYSGRIAILTRKAKGLGLGISMEGLKLVEARLVQMALDTANYKLELLKSMQSLEYDRKREKDIHWLEVASVRLRATEERDEIIESIVKFLGRLFRFAP